MLVNGRLSQWGSSSCVWRESHETRDTLLHGQLQEGLKHDILKGPAVSGAQSYKNLCLAAKNEEKRLAELCKRVQYRKEPHRPPEKETQAIAPRSPLQAGEEQSKARGWPRCYQCGGYGHISRDCKVPKKIVTALYINFYFHSALINMNSTW